MKILLLIGTGSFIGGISRYLLSLFIQQKTLGTFPWGTLVVNLTGCLLIGILYGIAEKGNVSTETKLFIATGVLGGFTTFSAFSNETVTLMNAGHYHQAGGYVLLSVLFGLMATFLGILLGKVV